jgi:arylamine N-acetyltransferase
MSHPLDPPSADAPLLHAFLDHFRIERGAPRLHVLTAVARAFARLPYENLTKIIKDWDAKIAVDARRSPEEVWHDHTRLGAGGTCFALTATLLHLVRALGWRAEPILADRSYGPNTHSAILVWIDDKAHLLDPGYLIVEPLPLPNEGQVVLPASFNDLILTATHGGAKIELATRHQRQTTYRLTFKTDPADAGTFLRAWDRSFDTDLLRYPVLSRVAEGRQIYLQRNHLLVRSRDESRRVEVDPVELRARIAAEFGIDGSIVERAFRILKSKGEKHGGA